MINTIPRHQKVDTQNKPRHNILGPEKTKAPNVATGNKPGNQKVGTQNKSQHQNLVACKKLSVVEWCWWKGIVETVMVEQGWRNSDGRNVLVKL